MDRRALLSAEVGPLAQKLAEAMVSRERMKGDNEFVRLMTVPAFWEGFLRGHWGLAPTPQQRSARDAS